MAGMLRFVAVEIVLPSYNLRLLKGSSRVTFGGRTFLGKDPTYGVLGSIGMIAGGGDDDQAPSQTITVIPPDIVAAATLANPAVQYGAVTVWAGELDLLGGDVLPTPTVEWPGYVDVATLVTGEEGDGPLVEFSCANEFEKLFEVDEGHLLNNASHQSFWPGERGCEYVTNVQVSLPVGMDAPRPVAVRDVLS